MEVKTPAQLLEKLNTENKLIADKCVEAIWRELEKSFTGSTVSIHLRDVTADKWKQVEKSVTEFFNKKDWRIVSAKFGYYQPDDDSWIVIEISPFYEQTTAS